MPVSVGNIPSIKETIQASVDPFNVVIGDIANTCKSNKAQSDQTAGKALVRVIDQTGPALENIAELSQALPPIVADMISLTAQVNAKLRPYEQEVDDAENEQIQIASSNNWYNNAITTKETAISDAQTVIDGLDTESETYDDDVAAQQAIIDESNNDITVYNVELGILNGPYATDWEDHRAYHQAIVDDIISIFDRYMNPIKDAFSRADERVDYAENNVSTASNNLLDAASNIAKNIAKTADKRSIQKVKNVAFRTSIQQRSASRSNDAKPPPTEVPRPEETAEPFIAKDGVLTYTNGQDAENDIAANKYPNERLIRINEPLGELFYPPTLPTEINIDYIEGIYQTYFARSLAEYERNFWLSSIEDKTFEFTRENEKIWVEIYVAADRNPTSKILSYATSRELYWNKLRESVAPTVLEAQIEKDWENYVIYIYQIYLGRLPTRDDLIAARDERLVLEQEAKDEAENGGEGTLTEYVWQNWAKNIRQSIAETNFEPLINSVFRQLFNRQTTADELNYWQNEVLNKFVYPSYEVATFRSMIFGEEVSEIEYNDPEYFENLVLDDYMQTAFEEIENNLVFTTKAEEDLEAFIGQLYKKYFSRDADPAGLAYWLDLLRQSQDPTQARIDLINGAQGSDRDAYIRYLYNKIFKRDPAPAAITYWNQQISQGVIGSRSELEEYLIAGAQSTDKQKADDYIRSLTVTSTIQTTFVTISQDSLNEIYLRLFDRVARTDEYEYWSSFMASSIDMQSRDALEKQIIRSARVKYQVPDFVLGPDTELFTPADYRNFLVKYNGLQIASLKENELIVVEGTKWLRVIEWEDQWFEKTGEIVDLETRYDVINYVIGERQDPPSYTAEDVPGVGRPTGEYAEPGQASLKTKLRLFNRFTGFPLLNGRYTVGSIGNDVTDRIAGALAHEERFQTDTKNWQDALPNLQAKVANSVKATAGMGGFDKEKLDRKKELQEVLKVYKNGVKNAETALEYHKFDSGKIVADITSPATEATAVTARSLVLSAKANLKYAFEIILYRVNQNVPGLLNLIKRNELPIRSKPSPDITQGARITSYYS